MLNLPSVLSEVMAFLRKCLVIYMLFPYFIPIHKYINHYKNRLRDTPESIGKMKSLCTLVLSQNELRYLPPNIQSLHTLKWLDLRGNLILGQEKKTLSIGYPTHGFYFNNFQSIWLNHLKYSILKNYSKVPKKAIFCWGFSYCLLMPNLLAWYLPCYFWAIFTKILPFKTGHEYIF